MVDLPSTRKCFWEWIHGRGCTVGKIGSESGRLLGTYMRQRFVNDFALLKDEFANSISCRVAGYYY